MTSEEMEQAIVKMSGQLGVLKDLVTIMLARDAAAMGRAGGPDKIDEHLRGYSNSLTSRYRRVAVEQGPGGEFSTEHFQTELDAIIAEAKRIAQGV